VHRAWLELLERHHELSRRYEAIASALFRPTKAFFSSG
jgi:hypothetical protein